MDEIQAVNTIKQKFAGSGRKVQIPLLKGGHFTAEITEEGIKVDNLGTQSFLPWTVFKEALRLLVRKGGHAERGDAMASKLGDKGLSTESIEGRVASVVYGKRPGDIVFRRITPIACILIWAGICRAEPRKLVLLNREHGTVSKAAKLKEHIEKLKDFEIVDSQLEPYGHIGATLFDAVFQAGIDYDLVVKPRADELLRLPQASTVSGFLGLIESDRVREILRWNGDKKIDTLRALTRLLAREGIETEADLQRWFHDPANLEKLARIKGIGTKTQNYLQILVGIDAVAIDVHLRRFLEEAELKVGDEEAYSILYEAAKLLGVSASVLDHSIWLYMSQKK